MPIKNFVLAFSILFCSASFSQAGETLPIVGDSMALPKNWVGKDKQPHGLMIDLLEAVSKKTDIKFTYDLSPWNRAFSQSSKGKGGIIGLSKTTRREAIWDYSDPMYYDEIIFVTTKDKAFKYEGLDKLDGRRLAIKTGASYGDDFEIARAQGWFKAVETTERSSQLLMLAKDRVDLVLVSPGRLALQSAIANNSRLEKYKDQFVVVRPPFKLDPNYLGIPKSMGKAHLLGPINRALADMRESGEYKRIIDANIAKASEILSNQ